MISTLHKPNNTHFSRQSKLGKKTYWLFGILLFLPLLSHAQSDAPVMCAQITKAAVSPSGHCQTFRSPCDIPQDWKMVPSCDAVEDTDFGSTPEDIDSRRLQNRWEALRARIQAKKEEAEPEGLNASYRRLGSASLGRGGIDREVKDEESPYKRRTMSDRQYHSQKYNIAVDYRRNEDTTENERNQRRQSYQTRLRYGTATEMDRSSPLSSKPKWFVSSRKHFKDNLGDFSDRWRSSTQILQDEAKAKREARESITEGPALQKIYTGARREGDIEKALLDIDE